MWWTRGTSSAGAEPEGSNQAPWRPGKHCQAALTDLWQAKVSAFTARPAFSGRDRRARRVVDEGVRSWSLARGRRAFAASMIYRNPMARTQRNSPSRTVRSRSVIAGVPSGYPRARCGNLALIRVLGNRVDFARTSWWWTQSPQTGLRTRRSPARGKISLVSANLSGNLPDCVPFREFWPCARL